MLKLHRFASHPASKGARGFAIIMAIFVLVVLALLGSFVASTSTLQHTGTVLDVMGLQAYQAANAGIEWSMARLKTGGVANCTAMGAGTTFAVDTMNVTVSCNVVSSGAEAGSSTVFYAVTATACNEASCPGAATSPNYIERSQSATSVF